MKLLAASLAALMSIPACAQQGDGMRILILEGENARHNIRRKAVSPTMVEVRDDANKPVPGARVVFTLPALGPGGRFADGGRVLTVLADGAGRASLTGSVPNDQEGQFRVVVQATDNGRSASVGIVQNNVLYSVAAPHAAAHEAHSGAGTKLLVLLAIGAAVAAGGIAAAKSGGPSAAAAPSVPAATAVSVGAITIGGPH